MDASITDLTDCDLEPIHIPGKIQPHGFLLAVNQDNIISFISANTPEFVPGVYPNLLNKPLANFKHFPQLPAASGIPTIVSIGGRSFHVIVSAGGDYTLLEFEPKAEDLVIDAQQLVGQSVEGILAGKDLPTLLTFTAAQVKKIIQFDRVMIYRFAADGHGEVVAEAKADVLDPWLGLHYPASDIPKQARELYKLNKTRLIASVNAAAAGILTTGTGQAQQLDLTWSQLRAVSPIHIQYLKNMGVASSFSISLMYKNELWGLIACHNYTDRFIDYSLRESAKLVGQLLSAALEFRQDGENLQLRSFYQHQVDIISKNLHSKSSIEEALMYQETNLLQAVPATGIVLAYNSRFTKAGLTPDDAALTDLLNWISEERRGAIFYTDSLAASYPAAAPYQQLAAGIMAIPISREHHEYVIWFREERIQQVKWAGNPDKPVEYSPDGLLNISPRHSFETWTKEVAGTSIPWSQEEIKTAIRLKEEILISISTKASAMRAMNEKLSQAYEELDTFSFTISHDLKTPITAIKGYAQLLAGDAGIPAPAKNLLLRISDRADKMTHMIRAVLDYSRIGRLLLDTRIINTGEMIKDIVQDLEQVYGASGVQINIGETPSIHGDPVMMWQVFSNLISNAVKYAINAKPPVIHIEGSTSGAKVFYTIRDNGIGIPPKDIDRVFILFSRMDNVKDIEGTGVGLAIVKKIVEKHAGSIWVESELGKGTSFFLSFNRVL